MSRLSCFEIREEHEFQPRASHSAQNLCFAQIPKQERMGEELDSQKETFVCSSYQTPCKRFP